MEVFDLVNQDDVVIGTATREECHSDPKLLHRTVHFTLFDPAKKKVFLTQRSFKKETDPGMLCFLGEHVLSKESSEDALKRGCKEELGFIPSLYKETGQTIFKFPNQTELVRFFVIFWHGEKVEYDKEEVIDINWLSLQDLEEGKSKYSQMTKYWVENVDWESI